MTSSKNKWSIIVSLVLIAWLWYVAPLLGKQYNYSAPTWADRMTGRAELSWCVVQPAPPDAEPQIEAALAEWSKYVQITFRPGACYGDRTLTFSFVPDDHGDKTAFRGRDMAHAFWPAPLSEEPMAGDIHFRASEDWSPLDIYLVALHEVGHALGIWDVRGGVMDEVSWWRHLTLQTSDIEAARRHYARRCFGVECAWGLNR